MPTEHVQQAKNCIKYCVSLIKKKKKSPIKQVLFFLPSTDKETKFIKMK